MEKLRTDKDYDSLLKKGFYLSNFVIVMLFVLIVQVFKTYAQVGDIAKVHDPSIIEQNGTYYLFVSFDYCCRGVESTYKIIVGRSSQLNGWYYDKNGKSMLSGGGALVLMSQGRWHGPSSNAVFVENGSCSKLSQSI